MQKEETDLATRIKSFAAQIIRLFSALPRTTEAQVIGRQILRSGTSVGANYRDYEKLRKVTASVCSQN
jgi:four helix bundle protein